jgi:uncharacterized protein
MKKALWYSAGMACLVFAYIGLVTPGIPFSIFLVMAAYCFSKSSERMHRWIYNHKQFGPFLTNWQERRIFPTRLKFVMIATMASTLVITYILTENAKAVMWSGGFMLLVAIWAWRYPGSVEEYDRRKSLGIRIAWLR